MHSDLCVVPGGDDVVAPGARDPVVAVVVIVQCDQAVLGQRVGVTGRMSSWLMQHLITDKSVTKTGVM